MIKGTDTKHHLVKQYYCVYHIRINLEIDKGFPSNAEVFSIFKGKLEVSHKKGKKINKQTWKKKVVKDHLICMRSILHSSN